jgi:hypothetical protein
MEVESPTWNAKEACYLFRLGGIRPTVKSDPVYLESIDDLSGVNLPVLAPTVCTEFLEQFCEKTKKWFTNPLSVETLKKRLRHEMVGVQTPLETVGWYCVAWQPVCIVVKQSSFLVEWMITQWNPSEPQIGATFLSSTTPRAQSPVLPKPDIRTIQIQDTLIPIGDLPLSDVPDAPFQKIYGEEDLYRKETKRKLQEARLKLQLAKLKAKRMERLYVERYGMESEGSSESGDTSDSNESLANRYS